MEWIPVNERLPEKEGKYLVWIKWGNIDHATSMTWLDSEEFITTVLHTNDKGEKKARIRECTEIVTHWMPLPDPPKPKQP